MSIFGTGCERPGSLVTETYLRFVLMGRRHVAVCLALRDSGLCVQYSAGMDRQSSFPRACYVGCRILRAGNFIHSAKSLRKLPRALKACSKLCVGVCVCVCAAHMLSMSNSVIMRDLFVCQGFIFTTILCFAGAHCGADIPQGVCLPVIPVCCWGSALVNEVVVTGPALII